MTCLPSSLYSVLILGEKQRDITLLILPEGKLAAMSYTNMGMWVGLD